MELRPEQEMIMRGISNDPQNVIIQAGPGAGKTFMLNQIAKAIREGNVPLKNGDSARIENTLFLAFNVSIVKELEKKLPAGINAKTINSFGFAALRKMRKFWKVDANKYGKLVRAWASQFYPEMEWNELAYEIRCVKKIITFLNFSLTKLSDDDIRDVVVQYDLENFYSPELHDAYRAILWVGELAAKENIALTKQMKGIGDAPYYAHSNAHIDGHVQLIRKSLYVRQGRRNYPVVFAKAHWIDFDEQIILPIKWNLDIPQYDVVLVDEGQDQNYARWQLLFKAIAPHGRMIVVGDSNQAIMGFSGALAGSLEYARQQLNATVLNITESFRLAKSHTDLAREMTNFRIKSVPWANEGQVVNIDAKGLIKVAAQNYYSGKKMLVMSRFNAPLIQNALALLVDGIPSTIRGRDFGQGIISIIKKIALRGEFPKIDFAAEFSHYLGEWYGEEFSKLDAKNAGETAFQSLEDRYLSLKYLHEMYNSEDAHQLISQVENLFDDKKSQTITFSTGHRAKGDEAPQTAILGFDKLPFIFEGQSGEQATQEMNVLYVLLTRALSNGADSGTLYLVTEGE